MTYQKFHDCVDPIFERTKITDRDGTLLYENEWGGLLAAIVKRDDCELLEQYITAHELSSIPLTDMNQNDAFSVAAANGNINALRILLRVQQEHNPDLTETFKERRFTLLTVACYNNQLEMARFLLDSDPPLGSVNERDWRGPIPLPCAAESIGIDPARDGTRALDRDEQGERAFMERTEALTHFLLDRGACATDMRLPPVYGTDNNNDGVQPLETVLGNCVGCASYALIKRLLDSGADMQLRQVYNIYIPGVGKNTDINARDVTVMHLASQCWNLEGIRCLLDNGGGNLLLSRDSTGRLPLHWAAFGPDVGYEHCVPEWKLDRNIAGTVELLITAAGGETAIINDRDEDGGTPLYYAVSTHARCGSRGHALHLIQCLLDHGADATAIDNNGQSVLHRLAYSSVDGDPINPDLLDLLVAHGAPLDHQNHAGATALHIMCACLRQSAAAKALIAHGARIDIRASIDFLCTKKGDTPLHQAMRGFMRPRTGWDGKHEDITLQDRIRAQDEIVAALQAAAGGVDCALMDLPNAAGKTPRQLHEETRQQWRDMEARYTKK